MVFTEKQNRFINEYPVDLDGTKAAIRAGYSEKTAAQQASRLLRNVNIQNAIKEKLDKRQERTEITADKVLKELGSIGFNAGGERTADRLKALELIGKHLGMYTDRVEMTAEITESDVSLVEKVRKRLEGH